MPDNYDLGTAHGKIEIKSDVDAGKALAELAAMKAAMKGLEADSGVVSSALEKLQSTFEKIQSAAGAAAAAMKDLGSEIAGTIGSLSKSLAEMNGLNTSMEAFQQSALKAAGGAWKVYSAINQFRTLGGVQGAFMNFAKRILGVNEELARFPLWMRKFVTATGTIGTALAVIGTARSKILPVARALLFMGGTALPGLTAAAGRASLGFKTLGFMLGTMFPSLTRAANSMGRFGAITRIVTPEIYRMMRNFSSAILGAALFSSGIRGLASQMSKLAVPVKLVAVGLAALSAVGPISTVILGMANAVKQLSGSLLILPGAIATMVPIAGVALVAFKGLGAAMQAAFGDADKFDDAIKDMDPHMQKLARAAKGFKEPFQELGKQIQGITFGDLANNFEEIGNKWFPLLKAGSHGVAQSLNGLVNNFARFAAKNDTLRDTATLFENSRRVLGNMAASVVPFMNAMRDVGTVGSNVFAKLTGGLSEQMALFETWANRVRGDGSLERWMENGVQGFRDLKNTIKDSSVAIGELFRALGGNGNNALERLAAGAEKFRNAVENISDDSAIGRVFDHIQKSSQQMLGNFITIGEEIGKAFVKLIPAMEAISQGFGSGLTDGITIAARAIGALGQAIHAIGLDGIVGQILGWAAAFRILAPIVLTAVNALKLLSGAFVATKLTGGIMAAGTALAGLTRNAGLGATAVGRVATVTRGLAMAAGPASVALMAIVGALLVMRSSSKDTEAAQKNLEKQARETAEGIRDLNKAYEESNGKAGAKTYEAIGNNLKNVREGIDETVDSMDYLVDKNTSVMGTLGNSHAWGSKLKEIFYIDTNASEKDAEMRAIKERALEMQSAFDKAGYSAEELNDAVANGTGYEAMLQHFRSLGEGGKDVAIELVKARQEAIEIGESYKRIGEGPVKLANAVEILGDKASTASEKLDAMKSALEAMGLLQVDAVEAASRVTEAVDNLSESLQEPLGPAEELGRSLVTATGALNATNPAAQRLWGILRPFSESLRSVAASGGDVEAAWRQMTPALEQIQEQTNLSDRDFQRLLTTVGLVPDELSILMSVSGMDAVDRALYVASKRINSLVEKPINATVTATIEDQGAIDKLRSIGVWVKEINKTTGEVQIRFPGEDVKKRYIALMRELSAKGIDVTADLPPEIASQLQDELNNGGSGYTVDVQVKTATDEFFEDLRNGRTDQQIQQDATQISPEQAGQNIGQNFQELAKRQQAARAANPGTTPENPTGTPDDGTNPQETLQVTKNITIKVLNADVAKGAVDGVRAAMDALKDKTVKLGVTNADVAWGAVQGIKNAIDGLRNKTIKLGVTNADVAWGAVQGIKNAMDGLRDKSVRVSVTNADVALGAVQGVIDGLVRLGQAAQNAAVQVSNAMRSVIGAVNELKAAIQGIGIEMDTLAAGATQRGLTLSQNYAAGIRSGLADVQAAGNEIAEAASGALGNSPAKWGPLSGRGWTLFRGRRVTEDYAKGIHEQESTVKLASLGVAMQVSAAMDQVRAFFGLTETSFDANRTPGPGGKKYYRDPELDDAELAKARRERAKTQEASENDTEDNSASIADANRRIGDNEKRIREAEAEAIQARTIANRKTGNQLKDEENETRAANAEKELDNARDALKNSQNRLKELQDEAASASEEGSTTTTTSTRGFTRNATTDAIDSFVRSMDSAQYAMGGFSRAMVDCSGFVSAVVNVATGRPAFSERASTVTMGNFLRQRGFKEGQGGPGDLTVGWWDNGGGANGHAALTTPSGLNAESTTGGVRYGSSAAGGRSNNGQFSNFMYLPISRTTDRAIQQTAENTGATADSTAKTVPLIKNADGTYGSSNPEWNRLIQRESGGDPDIVQQVQDANSGGNEASGLYQIALGTWESNGGTQYAPSAGEATPEQQSLIAAKIAQSSGAGPWGNRENGEALKAGLVAQGSAGNGTVPVNDAEANDNQEVTIDVLRQNNAKLNDALSVAQNPMSSDAEVIRSLQDIDDSMVGMSASERDTVNAVRESIMTDRGIKEYDPYENAPKDAQEWFDTIFQGIAQNLLSMYNTIEQGLSQAVQAVHLLSRGFSNTKDVNTFVDGMQSIVSTFTQIATTVGSIVETVGNIAAAAGSAIPQIGQFAGVISGVTGVIGNVSAVIDFMQEIAHIGGRWIGGGLSNILGLLGGTGELQGQVKALLDTNDNTIKMWSDRNAADKAILGGSKNASGGKGRDPNQASQFRDLNIYQGPGQDPADMMNNAMFAVSAHSQGVYGA